MFFCYCLSSTAVLWPDYKCNLVITRGLSVFFTWPLSPLQWQWSQAHLEKRRSGLCGDRHKGLCWVCQQFFFPSLFDHVFYSLMRHKGKWSLFTFYYPLLLEDLSGFKVLKFTSFQSWLVMKLTIYYQSCFPAVALLHSHFYKVFNCTTCVPLHC